ncbi:RDD family protein [Streptomyces sp. NPDC001222]|uniref:RDD family protein n=1 Tax=Streptomyces sp. NPDC001222 TaxID=3364548 RepID=UPI0036CF6DCA
MSFGSPNNPYGQPQNPQQGYGYPQQGQQPGYGYPQAPGVPPQGAYGYPQTPGYAGPPAPRVASMGRRFGARLIDGVVFGVIYAVLAVVGVAGAVGAAKNCDPNAADYNTCINNAGSDIAAKFGAVIGVLAIIGLLYEWLMVGLVGRTLGKMAVGLHVVNAETGGKPGLGKSFIRWIIPTVGAVLCGIGQLLVYLSPFWDKSGRQQGWHDKAAGTMVVQN